MRNLFASLVAGLPLAFAACVDTNEPELSATTLAATTKVEICHVPPGNPDNAHTIEVGAAAVDAHLAHGDALGACGANPGVCPCSEPRFWQLFDFGGLYCTAPVSGGRLSVCTRDGQPACTAFAGDGSMLPLEDCAACLPAVVNEMTITDCSQLQAP